MTTSREKVVEWAFGLLSVVVAWNLQLSQRFASLATSLGAQRASILYLLIVNGGVPVSLMLIAGLAMLIYRRAVWPFWPGSTCSEGWWVYALVARGAHDQIPVAGYFKLNHDLDKAKVPEGRAFYFDADSLVHRGDWSAERLWLDRSSISAVFNMRALAPSREPLPSHYDGFLHLSRTSDSPIIGRESWRGYFNDLGDRHDVWGPLYAERLSRWLVSTAGEAEQLLRKDGTKLRDRALATIT